MSKSQQYVSFWKKYLPVIALQMKNAKNGAREVPLNKSDFTTYGNRNVSEYFFNIEIVDGEMIDDNISGTPVARDLKDLLFRNETVKELIKTNNYAMQLGRDYVLHIQMTPRA